MRKTIQDLGILQIGVNDI